MIKIPLFMFPTKVIIFDDDIYFSRVVKESIEGIWFKPIVCDSYEDISKHIENSRSYMLESALKYTEEIDYEDHTLEFSLKHINHILKEPSIKDICSILIIDHDMPGKKGLEILQEIKNIPIKKILLTGTVNHSQAISSFNAGNMNVYLPKQSPNLYKELNSHADTQAFNFFLDLSNLLAPRAVFNNNTNTIFFSQEFKTYLFNIINNNNITEYYTLGLEGIFRLNSLEGKSYILAFIKPEDFESYYAEHGRSHSIDEKKIDSVLKKNLVPFTIKGDRPYLCLDTWSHSMRNVIKVAAENSSIFHVVFYQENNS